jgi:hypothetical protein
MVLSGRASGFVDEKQSKGVSTNRARRRRLMKRVIAVGKTLRRAWHVPDPMSYLTTRGLIMKRLSVLGVAVLTVLACTAEARAQRGGGAVRGGMRGAMVGGMVGGESGAQTGAKIGVVTGATRAAVNRETQARSTYQSTVEYQNAPNSNFNEAPPELIVQAAPAAATQPGGEAIVRHGGKPIVGVTFPADWKQKTGEGYVSAVSSDGQAYSVFASMAGINDKQAGIKKIKEGLEKYLTDLKFDELTKTQGGALVLTGTGKAKKAGVAVDFAAGVFDAGPGQLAGAAFVVDSRIEDHYKETVRGICETIRRADALAKQN